MKSKTLDHKIFILACCLVLLIPFCRVAFGETAPPEVVAAAEAGLLPFLKSLPPEELGNFGFSPADPIDRATPGIPFKVYTITPDALADYQAEDTVSSLLSPTGMWYFPITIDGEMKCILTVAQVDGSWQAVGVGKAALAAQLQEVVNQWPKSRGYDPVLIMVFQAHAYFFAVPQVDDYNLNSFVFEGKGFGDEVKTGEPVYSTLTGLSEIVGKLKAVVAKNIEEPN